MVYYSKWEWRRVVVMNKVEIFSDDNFGTIEVTIINGEPWFKVNDIYRCIGITSSTKIKNRLKKHIEDKDLYRRFIEESNNEIVLINQYSVLLLLKHDETEEAIKVKMWILNDILSNYNILAKEVYNLNKEIDFLNKEIDRLINGMSKMNKCNNILKREIDDLIDSIEFCKKYKLLTATEIAEEYGENARWLNNILCDSKIQERIDGRWRWCQEYEDNDYMRQGFYKRYGEEIEFLKWTEKGRVFIYQTLKDRFKILPLKEIL